MRQPPFFQRNEYKNEHVQAIDPSDFIRIADILVSAQHLAEEKERLNYAQRSDVERRTILSNIALDYQRRQGNGEDQLVMDPARPYKNAK